jgi:hypothetical protein
MPQDPNCRLFIIEPRGVDGSRRGFAHSMTPHLHQGHPAAYLAFSVVHTDRAQYLNFNRYLASCFGLDGSSGLSAGFPDQWDIGSTERLSVFSCQRVPVPDGVSCSTEVSHTCATSMHQSST